MSDHHHDHEAGINRRDVMKGCGLSIAFAGAGLSVDTVAADVQGPLEDLYEGLPKNWGRWGEADELGALNFLDSQTAADGMDAALQAGRDSVERITLQMSMTGEKALATIDGDPEFVGREPARRDNVQDEQSYDDETEQPLTGLKFADDKWITPQYCQGTTHADALGHTWYGEKIWNGFDAITTADRKTFEYPISNCSDTSAGQSTETRGLGKADISNAATAGIAARGVLLDVGREMGGADDRLAYEESVTLSDLKRTADAQGVTIQQHDVLLVRTGSVARARDPDAAWEKTTEPGLKFSEDLYRWIYDKEIPLIGADNLALEKVKQNIDGVEYVAPLHPGLLRNLGVTISEILWLEELGEACARDGIYDFLFSGAPLKVERATGAPFNPLVLKASP